MAKTNQNIEELNELESFIIGMIQSQRLYTFRNKPTIIFDSSTGLIFANPTQIPLISFLKWEVLQQKFELEGIAQGQWKAFHDYNYRDESTQFDYGYSDNDWKVSFPDFPTQFYPTINIFDILYKSKSKTFYWKINNMSFHSGKGDYSSNIKNLESKYILPAYHILKDDRILPTSSLSAYEKAKIILDFFVKQGWIPCFEVCIDEKSHIFCTQNFKNVLVAQEYNQIFDFYLSVIGKGNFCLDYRYELSKYPLDEISKSVLQYSIYAQVWFSGLLDQFDEWECKHQDIIKKADEIKQLIDIEFTFSKCISHDEKSTFKHMNQYLQQYLDISFVSTKDFIFKMLQDHRTLEQALKLTKDLKNLARIEKQERPSFELLVEHSATLCKEKINTFSWFEQNITFIKDILSNFQQQYKSYMLFLDKSLQELFDFAYANAVDEEHAQKWMKEWREERLILLKQWLPLINAGLNKELSTETVLATLQCLQNYQDHIDQFYLKERLGIYTKFAFQVNGHRQEQLEKESQLVKLNHDFMNELQTVIFSTSTSREKLWLLQYSEVWQQQLAQEIQTFLQQENLIERDDIAQLVMHNMRKLQQQTLASCLQDAQRYNDALEQRNKETNIFIFKMRKALQ